MQGDPLLFCLSLLELSDDIGVIPGLKFKLWYINMACLSKPSGDLSFSKIDISVTRVNAQSDGLELLRAPIVGSDKYFDNYFRKRADKVLLAQSCLSDLDVEFQLLRSCLGLCRLNHPIRIIPSGRVHGQLLRLDPGLQHSLQLITRLPISDCSSRVLNPCYHHFSP